MEMLSVGQIWIVNYLQNVYIEYMYDASSTAQGGGGSFKDRTL